jgi:hypothetical protein
LKYCGGCRGPGYCSKKCQQADWISRHKKVCAENKAARTAAKTSEAKRVRRELLEGAVTDASLDAHKKAAGSNWMLDLAPPGRRAMQVHRIISAFENECPALRGAIKPFFCRIMASIVISSSWGSKIVPDENRDDIAGCIVIEAVGVRSPGQKGPGETAIVRFVTMREMKVPEHYEPTLASMEATENRDRGDPPTQFRVSILAPMHSVGDGVAYMIEKMVMVHLRFLADTNDQHARDMSRLVVSMASGDTLDFLKENTPSPVCLCV